MFTMLDKDGDGKITFDSGTIKSVLGREQCEKLEALFQQLDKDGSGSISRRSLRTTFTLNTLRATLVAPSWPS